jgi:uncharacterized tellurite resistance protein B-like protein
MSLFESVREHLRRRRPLAKDAKGEPADLELEVAAALLLLEAAYGDEEYAWREERVLVHGLERAFGLGRREVRELLGRAEKIRPPAVRLDDVTELLAKRYGLEQRMQILELLWRVIEADRTVEPWEEAFARHVTGALGLTPGQGDEVRARVRP